MDPDPSTRLGGGMPGTDNSPEAVKVQVKCFAVVRAVVCAVLLWKMHAPLLCFRHQSHPFFQGAKAAVDDRYRTEFQAPADSLLVDGAFEDWEFRIDDTDAFFATK
jgi:hypothetical protein